MKDTERLKELLGDLLRSQKLAVLATHDKGQPYASLVAFAETEDLKRFLFATTRTTRKYANLSADSRVAMLVDSRSNQDSDIHSARAVTATGRVEEVFEDQKDRFLEIYLEKHPHMKDFVHAPTCALLQLRVKTYYLVSKFQKVIELHVTQ